MISDDGSVVLVFNGEIYNFKELRAELELKGSNFKSNSDTEVLLKMYLAEGEAMLPHLNGVFAFAIWDKRSKTLFIARDALGVKPLYYSNLNGHFAFASEIKALMLLVPEAHELNKQALHRYLSFIWCPGEGTPLTDTHKVLPGEALVVREGRIVKKWDWYQLPIFKKPSLIHNKKEAIEGVASHLRKAVERQMISDVPLGAFLSGGLDSSAIVAFASKINPDIRCFSIQVKGGAEEGMVDDLPYARKVAQYLHVPLDIIEVNASHMADDLVSMVLMLDEPLADPAALNALYISKLARKQGIKVLLSGVGGDDLFTGYRRHLAVKAEPYIDLLPRCSRTWLDKFFTGLDQRNLLSRRFAKLFNGAGLDGDQRLVNYYGWAQEQELFSLYTSDFRNCLEGSRASDPMIEFLKMLPKGISRIEKMLALEQRFFLADHNLIYSDKMSMAVGVELRVPFLDADLVDFAARIPQNFKQRGTQGKWVLKKAMEPYLPHEIIYRPKTGFGAPLRQWMGTDLRELLNDMLSVSSLKSRGLFDPVVVQGLILANEAGRIDASYTLLSLMCIEIWCRGYLDKTLHINESIFL